MPLSKCRECGEQVSSEAKTCPKCGIKGPVKRKGAILNGVMIVFAVLALSAFLGKKSPNSGTPTSTQEALGSDPQGEARAKERIKQIDAPLRDCLSAKVREPHPQKYGQYRYNDWGMSIRILLNKCENEVSQWCRESMKSAGDCSAGKCNFICDLNKRGAESIGVLFVNHVFGLGEEAIKSATPETPHNLVENAFRDCAINVILNGNFSSNISAYVQHDNYFYAMKSSCFQEVRSQINQCITENPGFGTAQCDQNVSSQALDILQFYNLSRVQAQNE